MNGMVPQWWVVAASIAGFFFGLIAGCIGDIDRKQRKAELERWTMERRGYTRCKRCGRWTKDETLDEVCECQECIGPWAHDE